MNFSDKILVTNPTTYNLGRGIIGAGVISIVVGGITYFTGDIFMPALAWCAAGTPMLVIGGILVGCGLTKR